MSSNDLKRNPRNRNTLCLRNTRSYRRLPACARQLRHILESRPVQSRFRTKPAYANVLCILYLSPQTEGRHGKIKRLLCLYETGNNNGTRDYIVSDIIPSSPLAVLTLAAAP